ncbi:hypothetical protein E4T48_05289 [Aureobasidium sp. EXF-10727]|nr:hypothetical protein E4T48_05289 [Aureobasidium sp. EXF-10727]
MAPMNGSTIAKSPIEDASNFITNVLIQQQQYYCLEFLCHFRILDHLPKLPGSASYADVAARANVPVSRLRAVARMAMITKFLAETSDGRLSHSPLSACFSENVHLRIQLQHMVEQTTKLMASFTKATELWGDTKVANQTAYNLAMRTELPFFEHLKSQPELGAEFDSYMKSQAVVNPGAKADYLLQGYDWTHLRSDATIVDVGGGGGDVAVILAIEHAHLRIVVQDLQGPIGSARNQINALPQTIKERIELSEHDMFDTQPVKGADVYFLRTIIHDWPDQEAILILRRLVAAMGPSSRIVIMDMVLPAPGTEAAFSEGALRQKDLAMIQTFNAKEREFEEWHTLIRAVDSRLQIHDIRRPEGCLLSVIDIGFRFDSVGSHDGHGQ